MLLFASSSTSGGSGGNSGANSRCAGIATLEAPGGDSCGSIVDVVDVGENGGEIVVVVFICLC